MSTRIASARISEDNGCSSVDIESLLGDNKDFWQATTDDGWIEELNAMNWMAMRMKTQLEDDDDDWRSDTDNSGDKEAQCGEGGGEEPGSYRGR
jgi:hypothetical protein